MSKKVKFARTQRPSGASTSAEHPGTAAQQGKKGQRKGASTSTIVGASLLAVGVGALAYLGRRNWPAIKQQAGKLKDQAGKATAGWQEQAGKLAADLQEQAGQVAAGLKDQAGQVAADLKDQAGKLTANQKSDQQAEPKPEQDDKGGKPAAKAKAGKGAGAAGDAALNAEVASATESSPGNEGKFTDEGATGNND